MSPYVVDASVVIKWYVPEALEAEALRVRSAGAALHAPDFLDVEVAAILWKKARRGELSRRDADETLADLAALPLLTRHASGVLVTAAFDLADQTGCTVYDCLYLALAVRLGGRFVTADEKLVNNLAVTPWRGYPLRLQGLQ